MIHFLQAILDFLQTYNGAVTAIATAFIAVFTIALALVTNRQAKLTRDAINLARDEFNATHRPKISVRRVKPQPYGAPTRVQYVIVNIGETPAIIKWHAITLYIQSGTTEQTQGISLECSQLEGGESRTFSANVDDEFAYAWGIASDSSVVKIRGLLEYEDGVGTTRRTGFLRTYDDTLRRFRASDDTEEEYED